MDAPKYMSAHEKSFSTWMRNATDSQGSEKTFARETIARWQQGAKPEVGSLVERVGSEETGYLRGSTVHGDAVRLLGTYIPLDTFNGICRAYTLLSRESALQDVTAEFAAWRANGKPLRLSVPVPNPRVVQAYARALPMPDEIEHETQNY